MAAKINKIVSGPSLWDLSLSLCHESRVFNNKHGKVEEHLVYFEIELPDEEPIFEGDKKPTITIAGIVTGMRHKSPHDRACWLIEFEIQKLFRCIGEKVQMEYTVSGPEGRTGTITVEND